MKKLSPDPTPSARRVFVACLLSFAILITPIAAIAAPRSGVGPKVRKASVPPKETRSSAEDLFVNPPPPVVGITATKVDTFPSHPSGQAEPGDTITYDVNVQNTGTDATGVNFSDTIDANTTLVPGSLKVSPLAFNDTYSATKDTPLNVGAPGVLTNDTGLPAPTAAPIPGGATTGGGTVTLNADGSFTYTPFSGFTGADTFTYTATNGLLPTDTATVTINVDAAPTVSSTTPTNGATNVATNSTITLNFSESVSLGATPVTISCTTSGAHTSGVSLSPNTTFTVTPTVPFVAGETCTVTVLAAQVTDTDSNDPPDNMAADYVFSFTTDAAPSVTSTTPTNGATNVATNSTITLNFSESVSLGATPVTISCTTSGAHTSGVSASPNTTFTVTPTVAFVGGETCTVTVLAAQVSDTDTGDPPDNMAANFVFSFSIDAAPTVTTVTPTNGSIQVASNTNIVVNFSENVNIVDATAFKVECPVGTPVAFSVTPAAPGATNSFTIDPTTDLPFGITCTVTVVAAKVSDTDANDPPDNMAADFVFSFTVDQVPTVTTTTPTNSSLSNSKSTNITINFSENVGVTAGGVTINCGAGNLAFSGLPQTNVSSIVLDPTADLPAGSTCTVTVLSANVTDTDTGDPPNNLDGDNNGTEGGNHVFTFGVAPDAVNDAYNATGNIGIVIAANGVLANDVGPGAVVDRVGPVTANNVVPNGGSFTSATFGGGSVTLGSDGSFTYVPIAGQAGGTDTFKYRISNAGGVSTDATVTINITGIVWFICDLCGGSNAGTLANPYTSINSFSVNNTGAANKPNTGQRIFIRSGTYDAANDNLTLLASQIVSGQGQAATSFFIPEAPAPAAYAALTAGARPIIAPTAGNAVTVAAGNTLVHFNIGSNLSGTCAAGSSPITGTLLNGSAIGTLTINNMIVNGCGRAINLDTSGTLNTAFDNVSSMNSSTEGIRLDNLAGTFTTTAGALQNATNEDVDISGNNASDTVNFTFPGTITDDLGTLVSVANQNGGTKLFSGAITDGNDGDGSGISLTNNTSATINFTGGVVLSTGANPAFTATGGGTVNVTQNNTSIVNTLTSTTGTALNVANTTIGASGLTFRSISSNGATNGIILNNTGATAGLTVSGNGGTCTSVATCTGGTIQGGTIGISLASTINVSFDRLFVFNTSSSGINGTLVTNFSFTNGKIDDSGTTLFQSNIAFNIPATTTSNIAGTLTITGNTLTNAFYSGVDIQQGDGTITNANISNNVITSTTSTLTSVGFGININGVGTATTAFALNNATISNNTIMNFPTASGIQIDGGNTNATGPRGTIGIPGDAANLVSITGNSIQGQSAANRMGGSAIIVAVIGGNNTNATTRSRANINISSNLTLTNIAGTVIGIAANGHTTMTATVNNNVIVANHVPNFGGPTGIGGGVGIAGAGAAWTGALTMTVSGNNISQTDGNGILLVNRQTNGTMDLKVTGNTVGAPINAGGTARQGIRIDSGNGAAGEDTTVCATISGNTSAGNNGGAGIGIRKEGAVIATNQFGITGLAPSPATGAQAAAFVVTQNPAGGGCDNINGSNYISCATAPPLLLASGGVESAQDGICGSTGYDSQVSFPAITNSLFGSNGSVTASLNQHQLDAIVAAAIDRWSATGLTAQQIAVLHSLRFELSDLPGSYLGEAAAGRILVDRGAQGKGWFVDGTPRNDSEFAAISSGTRRYTDPMNAAAGRVDLLTAIEHEIGHKLGLPDSYAEKDRDNLMYGHLTTGERRVPVKGQAANAQADSLTTPHFLRLKAKEVRGQRSEVRRNHAKSARALTASMSGETVTHLVGTLKGGKTVHIQFQVTVNTPFPNGTTQVSNQGSVTFVEPGGPVLTDDPSVGGPSDPTVTPVLAAADAVDDTYNAFKNTPLNVPAPGVLANDSGSPTVTAIGSCVDPTAPFNCTSTAGGTLVVNSDGSFTYTPPTPVFTGPDSFTYTATNSTNSDTATVNITVSDISAIFINEVLFNPPGTDAPNEYIELRGTPSSVIPAGTYLVAIEGDAADNPGDVKTVINLSGLTFGSNGFLVLLQNGNTYTTAAGATVVTSTTAGFGGLPGGIWSADASATDLPDASVTFMLIQTGVAPSLTNDIDGNDDGGFDGTVYPGWSVRDSISAMNGSALARAYGAFSFRNTAGTGTGQGGEVIVPFIPSYVGRVCDSTGSTAVDWVSSGVLGGAAPNWTLGSAAETEPTGFAGKLLNHIGASNFANLAPVNTVPVGQAASEDVPLVFTGANQISISDPDAGGAVVKVTLTAVNGTFSLGGTAGLTFTPPSGSNDGTNDTQMIFTGTIANINTALNNLTFTPPTNFFSPPDATLTILTEDQGNTGCGGNKTDSDTINITVGGVNDPPSFAIAGNPPAVNEDAGAQTVNGFATSISQGPGETGQTLTFNLSPTGTTGNIAFSSGPAINSTTGALTYTTSADTNGTATFSVTLSDNGSNVAPNSNTSGAQVFTITVNAVNDAPTFQIPSNPPAVNEDAPAQTINGFATNFQPGPVTATDEVGQTLVGYTVTANGTTGNLTFTSGPSINNAGQLTYTPTGNTSGTATFNVVATDSGSGIAPNVNQSAAVSFTITVNGQNDAPVLDNTGNMSLTAIAEDVPAASNPGTLVSDIILSAGGDRITDADAGAVEGIAVTAVDNTNGVWQFSIDNGTNWTPFGSPNATTARLLAANATTRVRFLPNLNFNGTVDPGITFRAWDQTSGTNGNTADTSVNGTTTAFSTATETASITVNAVNDNPTTIGIPPVNVNEDAPDTVIDLRNFYNDVEDGPAGLVYTITGNTNPGLFTSVSINNANDNLTLDYAPNASGSAQLTIRGTDSGGLFVETTLNVTVSAINDPPSFTKGADQTLNEDAGPQTVNGWATSISQGPGESGQTLTFNVSVGGTTGNLAFSSAPAIDATTGTLTYTTSANTNGTATINVSLSDNGSNAPPNSNTSAVQQFTISVNAVNDAPTFQIPSNPATVNEDAGAQTVNGFATNFQPGPATATDEVGQTLVGYTVTQTGTTGNLAFSSGPSINNAGQLTYTPSANTSGTATFNVVATDSGSGIAPNVNQSAPVPFTITVNAVNDAPVLDNTGNMSLTAIDEDVPAASNPGTLVSDIILSAGGDRITDVDSGAVEGIAVTAVDNTNGTWQFSIDNGTNWTAFGAPDALNARLLAANALTRVRFLPNLNFNGTVDPGLTFRAWDQTSGVNGNTADVSTNGSSTAFSTATETASITVNPVNDNPTTTGIPAVGVNEDAADTVLDLRLSFNDVEDGAAGLVYTVQGNTNPGLFTSVSINNGNDNLTLDYAPNANGVALITIRGTDTGGLFVDTTFMVTVNAVNDAPSFTKGPDITVQDPNPQSFPNWATNILAGPPDESGQTLTFLVSNNANGLFAAQPAISSNGTLTFTAAAGQDGVATVTVQLKDNGGTANGGVDTSAPQTFILTVHALNNPPTLNAIADLTINEDAPLQTVNLSGITPGPSFENNQTLTITAVSNNTALIPNPTVSYTNPNTTGSLSFTPVANINGSATITVTVKDTGGTANGGVDTFVRTFLVTVNSVNDAPSFTKGANQTVNEDAGAQTVAGWATAISAGPANESGQTVEFQVTGNTAPGLFSVAPAISPTGTLTYTPAANANGTATITLVLKDNGGTANGGVDTSAPQTFTITVNAVNDAPVNNVPGPQNTSVNTLFVFSAGTGNAISITDVDAGSDTLQVTIKATDGTITLNGTAGLVFTVGDGTDDPLMTFTGTLASINAALAGMKNLALGTGVITITTNDLGHNGTGGPLSDTDTIAVTVTDNLAPQILTIPGTDKAIAFESINFVIDPFNLQGNTNFLADHRTHIMIFALHAQLRPGETASAITAEADVSGTVVPLIVESVNTVPNFDFLTQIVFKFPDGFSTGGGGPHDAKITIRLRGQSSNQAIVVVVPAPKP